MNYSLHSFSDKKITTRFIYKSIFSNSVFIFFSFINLFLPFFSTIISSLNTPNGAIDVIGVGLSVSFITIFNQFLFLIALCMEFIFKRQHEFNLNNKKDWSIAANIMLLTSFVSILLFIGLSFIYINFSGIYQNIHLSINKGYEYISIVACSLIFNGFIYLNVMMKYQSKKWYVWILLSLLLICNLFFIPIFGLLINWPDNLSTFGVGLGIFVSSFIIFLIIFISEIKNKTIFLSFNWERTKLFLIKIKNFSINFLLSTFMKSILIMAIAISLGLAQKDTPPALMITKIIWYNSLFFCGFFADGLLYAVEYTRLQKYPNKNNIVDMKSWNILILLAAIVTLIICVVFNFAAMELANLYVKNQINDIQNPVGTIWPYGNLSSEEVKKYLWSPDGVYNFKLINIDNGSIVIEKSKSFALMYTTIYHVLINSTKIMSFREIEYNQKFNWKKLISNFIVISFVMIFVVVFSVVPNTHEFIKLFPGIDAFSFALMIVSILLFLLTLLGHLKKIKIFSAKY